MVFLFGLWLLWVFPRVCLGRFGPCGGPKEVVYIFSGLSSFGFCFYLWSFFRVWIGWNFPFSDVSV